MSPLRYVTLLFLDVRLLGCTQTQPGDTCQRKSFAANRAESINLSLLEPVQAHRRPLSLKNNVLFRLKEIYIPSSASLIYNPAAHSELDRFISPILTKACHWRAFVATFTVQCSPSMPSLLGCGVLCGAQGGRWVHGESPLRLSTIIQESHSVGSSDCNLCVHLPKNRVKHGVGKEEQTQPSICTSPCLTT